jgi:opacity protein-like surface antigen
LRGIADRWLTASVGWRVLAFLLCAGACCAQQYELSGTIGYGIYRDVRVNGAGANATAGIRNRFVAGAVICENMYEHISGEVRYLYQDGDPFLSAGGRMGNIQGQSHSFTYDVLFHVRDRDHKLRPYIAAGLGAKYYRTTGPEPNPQPAPGIADLVNTNQWRFLVDLGFGVKYRVSRHVILRADFRDYITQFPTHLFVPAGTGTDRGLFQMFTPMFGVGYAF